MAMAPAGLAPEDGQKALLCQTAELVQAVVASSPGRAPRADYLSRFALESVSGYAGRARMCSAFSVLDFSRSRP
jgi:hypothetical protein